LIVAKDIANRLRNLGHDVSGIARSGEEALRQAGETHPDLVLMDIRLEGDVDGVAAAAECRARWGIPVVFLTAYADEETVQRAKLTEPSGYVLKPFDATDLRVSIEMALYKHEIERRLKESETRYRDLINSSTDCVWRIDPVGRFTFMSPAVWRYLGYESRELIGRSFECVLTEGGIQTARRCLEKRLRGELRDTGVVLELTHRRKDGTEMVGESHSASILDVDGRLLEIQGVTRDVTERVRMQQALRESEDRFRQMAEHIDAVFWLTSMDDGQVIYVSPAYERVWGRPVQSLYDDPRSWRETVHPDDREAFISAMRDGIRPDYGDYEYRILRPDGALRWIHARKFPIRDASGQVYRMAGVAIDITERKQAEEERRHVEKQLQHAQKLESLATLAGGIAHDFNNLLMGILGNVDLARMSLPPDAPERGNLDQIEKAGRRALELSAQMLAYSGHRRQSGELINLSRLIRGMDKHLQDATLPHVIRYELDEAAPSVRGGAAQFRHILSSLIANASEAMGDSPGEIVVRTGVMQATREYLAHTYVDDELPAGEYVYLEVSDTGCGMGTETQTRIFDPFFSTKFVGRGLGLPAVLGLVRGYLGAVGVETAPGQGTTIRLLFPAAAESETAAEPSEEAWRGTGTILLIDDEEFVRVLGKRMMEQAGFEVITAANGREGVALFRQNAAAIVCVLLDLTMPRMGGDEVVEQLREIRPDIRIILSSGYGGPEVMPRFEGKNISGFLQKPYSMEELLKALRAAFAE